MFNTNSSYFCSQSNESSYDSLKASLYEGYPATPEMSQSLQSPLNDTNGAKQLCLSAASMPTQIQTVKACSPNDSITQIESSASSIDNLIDQTICKGTRLHKGKAFSSEQKVESKFLSTVDHNRLECSSPSLALQQQNSVSEFLSESASSFTKTDLMQLENSSIGYS